jgi:hypothetical protein
MAAASGDAETRGWRAITLVCVALADTSSDAEVAVRQVDERLRRDLGRLRDQYLPDERLALRKIDIDFQAAALWAALLFTPNSVELDRESVESVSWSKPATEVATHYDDPDAAALAARMAAGFHAVLLALDTWLDDATPQALRTSFNWPPPPEPPNLDEKRLRVVRSTVAAVGGHGPRADELYQFVTPTRIASCAPPERPLTRYRVTDAFPVEKGRNEFDRDAVLARLRPWLRREDPHESGLSEPERSLLDDRLVLLMLTAPGAFRIPLGPGSARVHEPRSVVAAPASDAVLAAAFTLRWATERILPRIGRSDVLEHVTSWVVNLPRRIADRETAQGPSDEPDKPGEQSIVEIATLAKQVFGAAQVAHSGETVSITLPVNGVPAVVELKIVEVMGVATVLARCPVPVHSKALQAGELLALQSGVVVGRVGRYGDGNLYTWHVMPSVGLTASVLTVDVTALVELAGNVALKAGS